MTRFIPLVFLLALAGCNPDPVTLEFSGETMGTTYNIVAIDGSAKLDAAAVQTAIDTTLAEVNAAMSNWDPNSEISRFNAQQGTEPVEISAELAKVMGAAMQVHEGSMGRFDVTLGPVIELWGSGARNSDSPVPEDEAIAAALAVVGQSKVLTLTDDPATMAKARPETSVYLAAIAKGYGIDELAAALREMGLTDYMVEIGGDLVASGKNPDGNPWRIGIERPETSDRQVEEIVQLADMGMATSGDYRNYFEEDGVRYSHIIDSETGRPITHTTASVTVLAENAMMADAWATALLALGEERGMEISRKNNLAVYFISRDPDIDDKQFKTSASPRFIELQPAN